MIVVNVSGGLGNQLFAYAAARSLSLKHGVGLVLDASRYAKQWSDNPSRPFLLDYFPLSGRFRHLGPVIERRGFFSRAWRRLAEDFGAELIDRDKGEWGYFSGFSKISSRAKLRGYFISPRFFLDYSTEIRRDLQLAPDFLERYRDGLGQTFLSSLSSRFTVGVHVRRGDFLADHGYIRLYLPEIVDYYRTAVRHFASRCSGCLFVIVSDDLEWSQDFFAQLGVNFVTVPQSGDRFSVMRDFFILSKTSHQIMSNSTFSWWAAWLGQRQGREVLMPPRWDASGITPIEEMRVFDWKILNVQC